MCDVLWNWIDMAGRALFIAKSMHRMKNNILLESYFLTRVPKVALSRQYPIICVQEVHRFSRVSSSIVDPSGPQKGLSQDHKICAKEQP